MAGYSCFATCKELKLSGSQGMYVVFAKDDQGSGLGQIVRWSGLFVEEICSVVSERGYSDFDKLFLGSGVIRKFQRSVQREKVLIRFGTRQGVGTLKLQRRFG
ncbi:hypothetical protein Bca52824_035232 [Brassica carinata]|uniref:Uncharacterized protein n=1 Tax=Brassica carinata TaxID=52824 RepID=A0A8X7S2C2_BRACI|nr:hypothetical protein Bca52824_035232 [Brassica carinata]